MIKAMVIKSLKKMLAERYAGTGLNGLKYYTLSEIDIKEIIEVLEEK